MRLHVTSYVHFLKSARFIRVCVCVGGGGGVKGEIVCVHASGRLLRMITFKGGGGGGGGGGGDLMVLFILRVFIFGLSEKTLFQIILGLVGISIRTVL